MSALAPVAFQEPAPMTEDLLEEQSEVLAKLGTSAEGAHLRARMQSACLLSDMESFKVDASFFKKMCVCVCTQYFLKIIDTGTDTSNDRCYKDEGFFVAFCV